MKLIVLLTVLLISACASGPRWNFEVQPEQRVDGTYLSWITSNRSNEFSTWTSSRVLGSTGGLFSNQSFVEVQSGQNTNVYVGIGIGDGYICGDYVDAKLAWGLLDVEQRIETIFFRTSKNNERLIFSETYGQSDKNRFLYMLNYWDKLTIQTDDDCGERTIVRFDIEGTHHVTTTQSNSEGYTDTIKGSGN